MSKHLESLCQNLLNGKLPHNLSWSEAVELAEHLGEVNPHGGDEFVFRVGSQRVFFKRPQSHDLGLEEVSRLRKLLKEAGPGSHAVDPAQPSQSLSSSTTTPPTSTRISVNVRQTKQGWNLTS